MRAITNEEGVEILANSTPYWVSEERILEAADTFTADFKMPPYAPPATFRWILAKVDAPALTPEGYKIP